MTTDRKAAIDAYRKRKETAGIFAIRCAVAGAGPWIGRTPTLDSVRRRLWFSLTTGADPHPSLQAAWTAHGADAFSFEILESFPDEEPGRLRDLLLKARARHWADTLSGELL
ncbi:MAG: GIY-YIG nuclease family protein [Telmatospirillum sp.]|nr:GIY-YIG nuclease family protein [Telmatospirillum sp.]